MDTHADAVASMAEAAQLRGEYRRAANLFRQAAVEYAPHHPGESAQMRVKARTAAAAANR